nr:GRP family sugar transporter [Schleiferilactobacillus shenzhenensis]
MTAACWGSISVVSHKIGGSSQNQILGESYGILFFALIYYLIEQPTISLQTMLVGLASGLFYCWGQNQQFRGLEAIGVSMGMPLSTAAQLVITTLAGAFIFGEWTGMRDYLFGFAALIILIIGAVFTSKKEKTAGAAPDAGGNKQQLVGIIAMLLSGVGISLYSIVNKAFTPDPAALILPQAIGVLIEGFAASSSQPARKMNSRFTYYNMVLGLLWALGNLFYTQAVQMSGLAISFSLSQMGVVISTLGGIVILREHKTRKELVYTLIGCGLVIVGGVLLGVMQA